jgi:hypothetical protein
MKRYIEIVYDNSGSMNGVIGNKTKFNVAQELFEREILPILAHQGDEVTLRLLGDGCKANASIAQSLTQKCGTSRVDMLKVIKSIRHDKSTPLFYAIADSVQACNRAVAAERLIFVLTDGDDTCGVKIDDLVDKGLIVRYEKNLNVLLVQLAIDSSVSSNNLTAFTNQLGGQVVSLDSRDSVLTMRKKINKALSISGFSQDRPLEHCYKTQNGPETKWEDIETFGINFHQAQLLSNENLLSWSPSILKEVTALQLAELKFLYGLRFKSGIPENLLSAMLSQLKKPYFYSHDCIYWDFSVARWKYFIPQNAIKQVDNPDAQNADGLKIGERSLFELDAKDNLDTYAGFRIYQVEKARNHDMAFHLRLRKGDLTKDVTVLRVGDFVEFK